MYVYSYVHICIYIAINKRKGSHKFGKGIMKEAERKGEAIM